MKYLLDTNAVIAIRNLNPNILSKVQQYKPYEFYLSSVVLFELTFGAYNSQRVNDNLQVLAKLPFKILDFNKQDAQQAGKIRSELKKKGTPIGVYDVLIAGQAIAQNLILITHNTKEFERIEVLRFEDWLV